MRQSRGSKFETEARPCEAEARPSQLKQEFVRPRWPYDMRPSARAEKYIRDAGP